MANDIANLIDRREACDALHSHTSRLCSILRKRPDREARAIGAWTLGDVANHVAWGIENYTRWLQGVDARDLDAIKNMSRWNIETVRRLPPADLPQLADRIEKATADFIEAAQKKPPSSEVRWYAGNRIPVEVAITMRLIEAGVHGLDVAAAAGETWELPSDDARTMSYGIGYIGPYFVDQQKLDFEGTIRVRIRGGADLYYIIANHQLRIETAGRRADWHLSVDPVTWVLVSTERRNQWAAALRGDIIGWGTRPRLPFKLRAATFQG
jgi:uncharacterized protein (TIGR03083 family)